ncbi:uncharacterized protein LOC143600685 [Bidens hawaiensis]|uniref:uncharacterized protein LOC143600685 n=1 Tax=Bidens hawaiensis TaxID=980011 RepID=UPI00404ACE42
MSNQEPNNAEAPQKGKEDHAQNEQDQRIPEQYMKQIQEMITKAARAGSHIRTESRQTRTEHSRKSIKSKSRPNPSHPEESVQESNAGGKFNRKFKKLKIESCSFKDFKNFGPKEFHGDKGAIATLRWMKEMQSIVIISKCAEQEKIQYTEQMLKGEALEWWNTLIMRKEKHTLYHMMWEEFKETVLAKFCLMHETEQIQSIFLNHRVIRTNLHEYNTKFHVYCRSVPQLVTPKSSKVTRYIWGLPREIRDMVRSYFPKTADSAMELADYLMKGLIRNKEEDKKVVTSSDHKKTGGARFKGKGVDQQKFGSNSNYTQCKICKNTIKADSTLLRLQLSVTRVINPATQRPTVGKNTMTCYNCEEMDHLSFECPKKIGMWSKKCAKERQHRVFILDAKKATNIPETITGCIAFMAYVTKESKSKEIKDVPIVSECSDVFPDELPGISPDREVEFRIDLMPGTAPTAKAPYRLAPTEMKELKKQLDKLLEKGFIRQSKANVVADAISRKELEKPKRVRTLRLEL